MITIETTKGDEIAQFIQWDELSIGDHATRQQQSCFSNAGKS